MTPLRSYTLVVVFCLPVLLVNAQRKHPVPPPATVQVSTDVQKIYIGEPIRLTLEATVPDNVPFTWPDDDSLAHFEILDSVARFDTVVLPGAHTYRQNLTITSWDSGLWSIPRLAFMAGGKKIFTDSIRIAVDYTKDSSKDFHDIRDIVEIPNPFARYFAWLVAGFTLISLALVVWLVRKRKLLKIWIPRAVVRLSPYEEALQQLDELHRQQLPETGKFKLHYTRLGEILREYLLRRLGISTHAETSEELIGEIRRLELLPPVLYDALAGALRMSDFVKFAKYLPGITESGQHFDTVRASIESMEQRERSEEERRRTDGQGSQENNAVIQSSNQV
jgi:hypothetical protein